MRRARQRRQEMRELRRRAEAAPTVAETPAASDATTTSGRREAPDTDEEPATHDVADTSTTSADAADAATDRPDTASGRHETYPPGDTTDPTAEPHRS
jgi:hypothetical protein